MNNQQKIRKISFKKVGRKGQHAVTLFEIGEKSVEICEVLNEQNKDSLTYAGKLIAHYWSQVKNYLMRKGFDDTSGLFQVINEEVKKYFEGMQNPLSAMPLWGAIEERDSIKGGQSGEYLAALIDYKCIALQSAFLDINCNKNCQAFGFVLDTSMEIQDLFFNLYLLENIQAKYSAGASRTQEANEKRNLRSIFQEEAERIYREWRNKKPKLSKEECYRKVEKKLKDKYPKQKPPAAKTIKDWFKSRNDLL